MQHVGGSSHRTVSGKRIGQFVRGLVGVLVGAVLVATACSSEPAFDRSKAVDEVLAQGGGRLTRPQAECYVDRVVSEIGTGALTIGAQPTAEQIPRLTRIRIDCTGVASLGTSPPPGPTTIDASLGTQPQRLGDDPRLDALYAACRDGRGTACDELFDAAPLGSDYEEFASTCGGRTKELRCADRYPAPGG